MMLIAFVAAVAIVQPVQGKDKPHHHRRGAQAMEQPATAKPTGDQPRDPADIALEKKIKSICRGC
ncbi:hypothetical protein ACVW1A_006618 [Bradyrhizobium sp. LB1.3]|uniref:hypothetical protein n=1 Tax=unclassified Bradyrhizobium TaxID=2631580 RepID=UPI001FFBE6BF|nr:MULTISPECIES: hypothetical protein [unclassified Bradyrhizobium]MCK1336413.1 hypothetical protein [Bradyrhizobium sp. 38]MCK1781327.1 hypothetical protein [Bradyrhizobium sp. 132]